MIEVGSTVGSYRVLQKIGQGAMGAVYLAVHPIIGRRVALKVIHSDLASDDEIVSRFFNEARAVTQIGHANIVDVQDFGQTPSGDSFIVMELLEGVGLGTLIQREGPLPLARAVRIAAAITDGLRAAHVRGIIHRDLKPDNVFLIAHGSDPDFVKILDFGLAKLTGPGAMQHKTRVGAVLGTAHYMAPEAAEDARSVDHRVDVYALGCVLFQMVIGRVPFPGDGFGEVLLRHFREPPPMPSRLRPDVPSWLEKIILHALAKKPEFRFSSMDEFGRALRDPAAWEQSFDDRELSPEEQAMGGRRGPALAAPRPYQLPADARTMSTPMPMAPVQPPPLPMPSTPGPAAPMPFPSPFSSPLGQHAQSTPFPASHHMTLSEPHTAPQPLYPQVFTPPINGTTELPRPKPMRPSHTQAQSLVRRRTASALGVGAFVLGGLALVLVAAGLIHHMLNAPVTVSVVTEPPGAELFVGDVGVGVSPAELKLPREHKLVSLLVQKAGYVSVQRSLEPVQDLTLDVNLLPEPRPVPKPVAVEEPPPTHEPAPIAPIAPVGPIAPPPIDVKPKQRGERNPRGHKLSKREDRPEKPAYNPEGLLLPPNF